MITAITSLFGLIGSGVSALFGFKQAQADVVNSALKVLGDINTSNADREKAIATIVASEANSGYWLAAVWRPLISVCLFLMIVCFFFGYVPPHMNDTMSPMMERIFNMFEVCLYGYIPCRTIDKLISSINIASVLKKFIDKKVL